MSQTGNSGYAARMLEEVRAALTAKDYARATQLAKHALTAGIVHPVLLTLRANALQSEGGLPTRSPICAVPSHGAQGYRGAQRHGSLPSGDGQIRRGAAGVQRSTGDPCGFPPALFNRGHTYELMGDLDAAREDYEAALTLEPDFPEPAARLASLATRRRDWAEVRARAARRWRSMRASRLRFSRSPPPTWKKAILRAPRTYLAPAALPAAFAFGSRHRARHDGRCARPRRSRGRRFCGLCARKRGPAPVLCAALRRPNMQTAPGFVQIADRIFRQER